MSDEKQEDGRRLEKSFDLLEEKLESLSARMKDLVAENARLRGAVVETAAERDRLRRELEDARELTAREAEIAEKVSRYEAEREHVRVRIEKLLEGLEKAATASA